MLLICSLIIDHKTIYIACFINIACIISTYSVYEGLNYFLFACIAVWLSPKNKFLSASVICLVDALVGLFLNYSMIDLLPCLIATILFIAIPLKLTKKLKMHLKTNNQNIIASFYVKKKQENLKTKLIDMSTLFKQMQKCYRDLVFCKGDANDVSNLFVAELKNQTCENCLNKQTCASQQLDGAFLELIQRAQKRGKVNLLDVPPLLTSNCNKLNVCLSNVNQMIEDFIKQSNQSKKDDENKLNISIQLGETSKIFAELSKQFDTSIKQNAKKSKLIKDGLLNSGIVCKECLATEDQNGVYEILLIVKNVDTVNSMINKVCEKVYNTIFEKNLCVQTKLAGWSLLSLIPCNRYELICGYASTPKTIGCQSGDNYVYTKLSQSKYLIAISDGMGHGEIANNISTTAINLIESYYKCGLSNKVVLDSVNNMLLSTNNNKFATLDAVIVDTISGEVDFIKIGSTISIIKQTEQSKIINVESLPLGIVENVVPTTCKEILFSGDVVVLASDGVVDVFNSHEEFCNFINNESIINMQLFADSILEEAQGRNFQHKDDMSVIAFRLIQKR